MFCFIPKARGGGKRRLRSRRCRPAWRNREFWENDDSAQNEGPENRAPMLSWARASHKGYSLRVAVPAAIVASMRNFLKPAHEAAA